VASSAATLPLYDILDAGRLLPASDNPDSADHIGFCNLVIAGVTRRIAPPLPA